MPQHSRTYTWYSCSAKIDNLQQPVCTMVSTAGFDDGESVLERAFSEGWTRTSNGKDFLCPLHSKESVDTPARAPRKPKTGGSAPGFEPDGV